MIVLASKSPRRREILAQAGLAFEIRVADVEERLRPGEAADAYVSRLSREKAEAVDAGAEEFVLAADTIVVVDSLVLEKPASEEDAIRMLALLSARSHYVLTGVCVRRGAARWSAVERTEVVFSPLSPDEILDYAHSGEPMDKAGAYAIQGRASRFVEGIRGCYFNVMGLPLSRVYRLLKDAGYNFAAG
ncbi:MAG: septum formation inhibitor Maf [Acidobacteria bacterium]|nr:septum formation inhibitor Maf [Acidobacteriota bacterium]